MPVPASSVAVLAQLVQRARQLYSLPAVVVRVLELTRNPIVDVRELQRCVSTDPALTSKLLRVINSSLFGLGKPVGDLNQAISLLGIQRLKMLVLGFSLPTHSNSTLQPAVLERYWRHALVKSVAARELAESVWKMPGDEAFVAGLLQDLGLLVLVQDLGDSYVKFLYGVWAVGNDPRQMQTEVLGFDHVQLTAKLLEDWGFPQAMLRAIAAPHDPQSLSQIEPAERALPQILDLAELLTRFLLDRQVRWLDELLDSGDVYLGLKIEQLYPVLSRIEKMTPQLADALTIPWTDEMNYLSLLEEAHRRQAETINQVASELLAPPRRPIEVLASENKNESVGPPARFQVNHQSRKAQATQVAVAQGAAAPQPHSESPPPINVASVPAPSLIGRLTTVVASCRQSRLSISLVLVQLDDFETLVLRHGNTQTTKLVQDIKLLMHDATDSNDRIPIEMVSPSRLGAILTGADRQQAIAVGRQILDGVRKWSDATPRSSGHVSVSIGLASLAMPPRNFPVLEMVQAAERCLNGVRLSGGNGLKSIDIC